MTSRQVAAGTPPKSRFEKSVESLAGGLGGSVAWLAEHGVLFHVFAVLWVVALPDYLDATDGLTPDGAPIGSLPYVVLCTAASLALLGAAVLAARRGRGRTGVDGDGTEPRPRLTGVG